MSKTYVVGDIHGRYDLLLETMRIIEEDAGDEPATFISLGDFVNRGPQTKQIIIFFMEGPSKINWRWVILKGNHEDMFVVSQYSSHVYRDWYNFGGKETLISYIEEDPNRVVIPGDHIKWLDSLPSSYLDDHRAYVHAGFVGNDLEQSESNLLWIRKDKYASYTYRGRHVVHGHSPYKDGPILNEHTTNLDTRAYRYGRLPIAIFDDDIPGGPLEIKWAIGERMDL